MSQPRMPREWNRTLRLLDYLEGRADGATLSQITDAIDPGASTTLIAGTLGNLMNRGMVRKSGKRMFYRYHLISGARDRPRAPRGSRPARTPPAVKPAPPAPVASLTARRPTPAIATPGAPKFNPDGPSVQPARPVRAHGALDSAQIAADVAAFEAIGGRVERLPAGQATKSALRFQHDTSDLARARAAITNRLA